jgi:hypothetical protein
VLIWVALALFVGSMIFGRHAEMDHATAAVQMENLSSVDWGTMLGYDSPAQSVLDRADAQSQLDSAQFWMNISYGGDCSVRLSS